ncbi:MAG: dTDP-4-dehydrorhamnose 3,5-epimerase [Flavobacteriaceae bacterium]|nr:dTDP-4-dehydrorhamnose 3,5-epimerase [Flavobacteriaceae bacterium]
MNYSIFEETRLEGCYYIQGRRFFDNRGYFEESFNQRQFEAALGRKVTFVQDNVSVSSKGVLRGLHFQIGEAAQAKLVRVLEGEVLDVVIDLRKDSPTYLQHISQKLQASKGDQLFIPRGFAHGYLVLSDTATFVYKCDNFYDSNAERGLRFNDPALHIDWTVDTEQLLLSERDLKWPLLSSNVSFVDEQ